MQFIVSVLIFTIFPVKKVPTTNELLVSAKQIIIYHIVRPHDHRKHEIQSYVETPGTQTKTSIPES